jgi:hypothetical protein
MLPILGLFQRRARDVMGYTFACRAEASRRWIVFLVLVPVGLLLVTILEATLSYPLERELPKKRLVFDLWTCAACRMRGGPLTFPSSRQPIQRGLLLEQTL